MAIDYATVERRAEKAKELMLQVNPEAEVKYTYNEFGKKLCNGLILDDCQRLCHNVRDELLKMGRYEDAEIVYKEVPLFVFGTLDLHDSLEFVSLWNEFMKTPEYGPVCSV